MIHHEPNLKDEVVKMRLLVRWEGGERGGETWLVGTHHGYGWVLDEGRVRYDVKHEVFADVFRGGCSPVSIEHAVEGYGVVHATLHLESLQAHARILHRAAATDLPVLTAAQREWREIAPFSGCLL